MTALTAEKANRRITPSSSADSDLQPLDLYAQLVQQGTEAYNAGHPQRAHRIWKRAAVLRPGDEQIWWLLLNVVESEADRLVCCHNVATINPNNRDLVKMLKPHYAHTQPSESPKSALLPLSDGVRKGINRLLLLAEGVIVALFLLAAVVIALSI
jgi:hypothetical protein